MTALAHSEATVPAHPLGQPLDGRPRYGMTPEQAIVYRWLIKYRPHHEVFAVNFRTLARLLCCGVSNSHQRVMGLVERGWIHMEANGKYRFVQPIMRFKEPRNG
jgi:hypothetical protein